MSPRKGIGQQAGNPFAKKAAKKGSKAAKKKKR